ncbi:MAG: AlwI family type II restriction endonuclease [Phycisphaerae bacterium]|nr:AlwI family type II restriction endonuclease [Phycisphaerae bacterium]
MAKKILWSMSTTVRNPERLVPFLRVLKKLEDVNFTKDTQMKYQILLIKERVYKPTDIPQQYKTLFDDITQVIPYDIAKEVFEYQNYVDPDMRGRQSVNPLNKLGFSIAKEKMGSVKITDLGNLFISPDANIGHIFFKSLLKLQFPNPISSDFSEKKGFNIRPFIAVMHLMKKTEGLSQEEFFTSCYWPREKFKEN